MLEILPRKNIRKNHIECNMKYRVWVFMREKKTQKVHYKMLLEGFFSMILTSESVHFN